MPGFEEIKKNIYTQCSFTPQKWFYQTPQRKLYDLQLFVSVETVEGSTLSVGTQSELDIQVLVFHRPVKKKKKKGFKSIKINKNPLNGLVITSYKPLK